MGSPPLDSCCYGCTTKTGTVVILWLVLIAQPSKMFLVTANAKAQRQAPSPPHQIESYSPCISVTDIADMWTMMNSLTCSVICTIALCGVGKGLHSFLEPYLIWWWIDFIITPFLPPPYLRHFAADLKKPQTAPSTV